MPHMTELSSHLVYLLEQTTSAYVLLINYLVKYGVANDFYNPAFPVAKPRPDYPTAGARSPLRERRPLGTVARGFGLARRAHCQGLAADCRRRSSTFARVGRQRRVDRRRRPRDPRGRRQGKGQEACPGRHARRQHPRDKRSPSRRACCQRRPGRAFAAQPPAASPGPAGPGARARDQGPPQRRFLATALGRRQRRDTAGARDGRCAASRRGRRERPGRPRRWRRTRARLGRQLHRLVVQDVERGA